MPPPAHRARMHLWRTRSDGSRGGGFFERYLGEPTTTKSSDRPNGIAIISPGTEEAVRIPASKPSRTMSTRRLLVTRSIETPGFRFRKSWISGVNISCAAVIELSRRRVPVRSVACPCAATDDEIRSINAFPAAVSATFRVVRLKI
jgi:hypothetical protein